MLQPPEDSRPLTVRALLESTGTPFSVAHYGRQDTLFRQGDVCDSVMHIEKGRVRLSITALDGEEAICGLVGDGAFLGEEVLGGRTARRQTAIALVDTEALVLVKAQMMRLLHTQEVIADRFIAHVLARQAHLEADLLSQLLDDGQQRVARALLVLAGCTDCRVRRCALPRVSQEIIAEMVGTTRSRVNTFISRFKKLGLVEKHGGVLEVCPALVRVADGAGELSHTERRHVDVCNQARTLLRPNSKCRSATNNAAPTIDQTIGNASPLT